MTAAEFQAIRDLHSDVIALRGDLGAIRVSLVGCQAASRVRQELAARRPSVASALAAWGSLALAVTLALVNLFR